MPVALIIAFVASIGLHAAALFGPEMDLAPEPDTLPILAELRPLPPSPPPPLMQPSVVPDAKPEMKPELKSEKPARPKRPIPRRETRAASEPVAAAAPLLSMPEATPSFAPGSQTAQSESGGGGEEALPPAAEHSVVPASTAPRLPQRGTIRFRVDRGDSNFEVGVAYHEWEFSDGHYRLHSVVETTGLVWLIRSVFIEMESLGRYSDRGLQPEVFAIRRDARKNRERALFDWDSMKVRVGDRPEQALNSGAQDLLSLYYQLGFLDLAETGGASLHVATGKKYGTYRLEMLGDEVIEVPLGVLRTRHLRAPGENATEFWLAYDYRLLPVKIRHVDSKGDSLVQVATEIQLGQ